MKLNSVTILVFFFLVRVFGAIINRTRGQNFRRKSLCRKSRHLEVNYLKHREIIELIVLKEYPWASREKLNLSQIFTTVLDKRNVEIQRKGYFVIGYDTSQLEDEIPQNYDFFVRFTNASLEEIFYLKPKAILASLIGCNDGVRFLYKDKDVVLKDEVVHAFKDRKLSFQREFYNDSANAGLILGINSHKSRDYMISWFAGSGLASNIEQDQTILRSLIKRSNKDFLSLPPNSVGRHVYSSVPNRNYILFFENLSSSFATRELSNIILFFTSWQFILFLKDLGVYSHAKHNSRNSLLSWIFLRFELVESLLYLLLACAIKYLLNNPIEILRPFCRRCLHDEFRYHQGFQIMANDMLRFHHSQSNLFVSDTVFSCELEMASFFNLRFLLVVLDIQYMIFKLLPLYSIMLMCCAIFLASRLKSGRRYNFTSDYIRRLLTRD